MSDDIAVTTDADQAGPVPIEPPRDSIWKAHNFVASLDLDELSVGASPQEQIMFSLAPMMLDKITEAIGNDPAALDAKLLWLRSVIDGMLSDPEPITDAIGEVIA